MSEEEKTKKFLRYVEGLLKKLKNTKEDIKHATSTCLSHMPGLDGVFHLIADFINQVKIGDRVPLLYLFDSICQSAKHKGLEYMSVAEQYAPVVCVSVLQENGVAHKLANSYCKTVLKVLNVWKTKEVFPAEMVDMIIEATKQAGDVFGEGEVELTDAREAKRLLIEAEALRRKQKEEKLNSALRPSGSMDEFESFWDNEDALNNAGGMPANLMPSSSPAAPVTPSRSNNTNKNDNNYRKDEEDRRGRRDGGRDRDDGRDRDGRRRRDDPGSASKSKRERRDDPDRDGARKERGDGSTKKARRKDDLAFMLELQDGIIFTRSLNDGRFIRGVDGRVSKDQEQDARRLKKRLDDLVNTVCHEHMLYYCLREGEPVSLALLGKMLPRRDSSFRENDPSCRRGDRTYLARWEHVFWVSQNLRHCFSKRQMDEVYEVRRMYDRVTNGALRQCRELVKTCRSLGRSFCLIGDEGLLSCIGLCVILGLDVDVRYIWTTKKTFDGVNDELRRFKEHHKTTVVMAEHHSHFRPVDRWMAHPIAERKSLTKVLAEVKDRYE